MRFPATLPLAIAFLLAAQLTAAQSPAWTRISDPTHPINTYSARGVYRGAAWIDANLDGRLDLFVVPNGLFLNTGASTFVRAATPTILPSPQQNVGGCSWADLDNDGDLDLVLAQFPSGVYRNDGAGQFTDITSQFPGLTNYAAWACAVADLNRDGRVDFLLVHANGFHVGAVPHPCYLYMQQPGGTFLRQTGHAFTDSLGAYTVPYFADYDQDGDQDLFIAAGPVAFAARDFCYRNLHVETGRDTLARMTQEVFATQPQDGQGYSFVDADADGDYDLCLTNYQQAPTRFFLNQQGAYVAATTPFTTTAIPRLGNTWSDFDLDGDLDVFLTSDTDSVRYYRNDGGGQFVAERALDLHIGSAALVAGDYDNDGDLDVFVNGRSVTPKAYGLFRSEATTLTGRHWVNLHLTGVQSNRAALGARVRLWATVQGQPGVLQTREINAQNTFQGHNDLRAHFGLDRATQIDSLEVRWPNGLTQRFRNVTADRFYELLEGGGLSVITAVAEVPAPRRPYTLTPNPAPELLELALEPTGEPAFVRILDALGRQVKAVTLPAGSRTTISTRAWVSGVYTVQVTVGSKVWRERVVRP